MITVTHIEALAIRAVAIAASNQPGMLAEYDRLADTNLVGAGSPLELAVDVASGRLEDEAQGFLAFVRNAVWERLDQATRDGLCAEIAHELTGVSGEELEEALQRVLKVKAGLTGTAGVKRKESDDVDP